MNFIIIIYKLILNLSSFPFLLGNELFIYFYPKGLPIKFQIGSLYFQEWTLKVGWQRFLVCQSQYKSPISKPLVHSMIAHKDIVSKSPYNSLDASIDKTIAQNSAHFSRPWKMLISSLIFIKTTTKLLQLSGIEKIEYLHTDENFEN